MNILILEYQDAWGVNLPDNPICGERTCQEIHYLPIKDTYWRFRLMIGSRIIEAGVAALALLLARKGTMTPSKVMVWAARGSIAAPFGARIASRVFTEISRQPSVVAPSPTPGGIDGVLMFTAAAVSPGISGWEVLFLPSVAWARLRPATRHRNALHRTIQTGRMGSAAQTAHTAHTNATTYSPSRTESRTREPGRSRSCFRPLGSLPSLRSGPATFCSRDSISASGCWCSRARAMTASAAYS
ncbi:MAG: cytochrome ubiquinol oxidase subunit I [Salinibacterium sp.]|nr:cytochrome ubiquinol oxidase subunit I [Salinibacterium sp.]